MARTARWTAAERARESARPDRLFHDPLAEALAGEQGRALAASMAGQEGGENPWFAIRTRFYDDAIVDSVKLRQAVTQVVSLAAGMDTRAYRLALPGGLAWYELDRPDLLALKDQMLTEAGAATRCLRRTVGVDLADEWTGPLRSAGFAPTRPTLWLVEGLIFCLEPATVRRLLDDLTRLSAPGSEILVDTVGRSMLDSPHTQALRDRLAQEGCPWQFGTDRPEDELLEPRGWRATVHLYSEIGSRLGRWPHPVVARDTPGVPQSFLVHGTR
ncbi:SAM-dependent methyltransferase [Streptomyces sp. NPDC006617]|uniref:class I SAM-dependent methyltransferase n=1 Tax=Streptomyces sp. NPDC006617 TaxID=3155354 RepID=UPI0033B9FEFB